MQKSLDRIRLPLERLDRLRDRVLFVFIKRYWPRKILPNHLTAVRIIIGILLFVILFYHNNNNKGLIILLFLCGAVTDLLDGSVSRAFHEETKLGAILDSTADRILIIPIAIYSLFSSHRWLFLCIVLGEVVNALISIWVHGQNIFIKSNIFGKVKMFLQSIVFAGILVFWPEPPNPFLVNILWLSLIFIIISIFFKIIEFENLKNGQQHNKNL